MCGVVVLFFPPPLCHVVGLHIWSFWGVSDSGVLLGKFFGRTGMQRLCPGNFEGCACLASDFDVSNGEI